MAVGLRKRWIVKAALFVAMAVSPHTASAQNDPNEDLYAMIAGQPAAAPAASNTTTGPKHRTANAAADDAYVDNSALSGLSVRPSRFRASGIPTPRIDQVRKFPSQRPAVGWTTWAAASFAILLGVLALVVFSPVSCLVLGHRRSRARVTFDEQQRRWVSNCKGCCTPLVRDPVAGWMLASTLPHTLEVRARSVVRPVRLAERPLPVFKPEIVERRVPVEYLAENGGDVAYPAAWSAARQNKAHTVVSQLLDDVVGGRVAPPGARGALFFVVDELRASEGMGEQARRLERISIRMQQLECALQRGDENEASSARQDLKSLAGDWMNGGA